MNAVTKGTTVTILAATFMAMPAFARDVNAQSSALLVQTESSQGLASPNNNQPANILVIVTDPLTGAAITGLLQDDFQIVNHFDVRRQVCGFSNNIAAFRDIGTGAYQLQVTLASEDDAKCEWVRGDYLYQVIVSNGPLSGQAVGKLQIEWPL